MYIGLQIPSFKYPGGTAAIRPKLKEIVTTAMGFTHAIFNMPDEYEITPLQTFAKEIIPAVAER